MFPSDLSFSKALMSRRSPAERRTSPEARIHRLPTARTTARNANGR